jgi:hypothetical protein
MVAAAIAAFAFTSSANAQYKPTGDDGITASPKVRQVLNERKASLASAKTVALPAMSCPKCADVRTVQRNPQAKGGQILAGTANQVVFKHTCTACDVKWTVVGGGKGKHSVATHTCTADVPNNLTCCASK